MLLRLIFRLCENGGRIYLPYLNIFSVSIPRRYGEAWQVYLRKRREDLRSMIGPAMFVSWRTSSNAPSCSVRARLLHSMICPVGSPREERLPFGKCNRIGKD